MGYYIAKEGAIVMLEKIGNVLQGLFLPVSVGGVLAIGGLFASGYLSIDYVIESLGEARVEWFRNHLDWFFGVIFALVLVNVTFNGFRYLRAKKMTAKRD